MRFKLLYKYSLLLALFVLPIGHAALAQQDSIQIGALARPYKDSIAIRWAPTTPNLWRQGNTLGYSITRYTLKKNGVSLEIPEEKNIGLAAIKPKPLMEWENLATQNNDAAVLAQAIYGERFVATGPGNQVGNIMAVNDENEQRFTFAMLAAEQSFKASKLAALGFTDTDVNENETYLYRIQIVENGLIKEVIAQGAVLTGMDLYEGLPIPYGTRLSFGDHEANLKWNYALLKRFYSRYSVERSEDGKNFEKVSGKPVFNAQASGKDQNENLVYNDSIPNDKLFYYRVKGLTAFDEEGPASEPLSGMAQLGTKYAPIIERSTFVGDNGVRILWSFDEEEEKTITGFELRRANKDNGTYKTIGKLLSAKTREVSYESLQASNYFKVVAMGKNGAERPSFAALVQPVDSIPPSTPKGLIATIDTTGVVRLSWTKNIEKDMLGYRVYRANRNIDEFTQLTKTEIKPNNFNDTLSLNTLNKAIYYRISAEDYRFNTSKLSEIVKVNLPDKIPPSPPLLKKYKILKEGIQLNWIPSSSEDLASHSIYRKNVQSKDEQWQQVFETSNPKDTLFLDSEDLMQGSYSYTIIAKDSTGLESKPTNPITAIWTAVAPTTKEIKFNGTVNRELRFIGLSWKVKRENIAGFRLYRGVKENDLKLYKSLNNSAKSFNDTNLEINSNYTYGLQVLLNGGIVSPLKKINLKY